MTAPIKAYSYLRFSTPEQAKGDSARRQAKLARDYAAKHGLALASDGEYQDLGVSAFKGRNATEGALGAFREAVSLGHIAAGSYLLVESLDRISREGFRKAQRLLEDICDAGIIVVTLNDGARYDKERLNNDLTAFLVSLLGFLRANEESETKAKRLRAAWEHKRTLAAAGVPHGHRCPAWLRPSADGKTWEVIGERAQVIRRIFSDMNAGIGPHSIAHALNEEGVPVFGRGQYWHRSYIVKLLTDGAVVGTYRPSLYVHEDGRKVRRRLDPIPNYYPPVVSEDEHSRVALVRDSLSPARGRHAGKPLKNLLSGLGVCGRCGSTLVRVNKGATSKGGEYLVCSRAKSGGGCTYEALRYGVVEDALLGALPGLLADAPTEGDESIREELGRVEAQEHGLSDMIEAATDALIAMPDSPALQARLRTLEATREELGKERDAIIDRLDAASSVLVRARVDTASAALPNMAEDRRELNAALRRLFRSVVLDYSGGELLLEWHSGAASAVLFRMPKDSSTSATTKET